MVVITVGERERAQVLVRLAGRNKHTLAFWMAPRLQMAFRDISLTRNQAALLGEILVRRCGPLVSSAPLNMTVIDGTK